VNNEAELVAEVGSVEAWVIAAAAGQEVGEQLTDGKVPAAEEFVEQLGELVADGNIAGLAHDRFPLVVVGSRGR